MHHSHKHLKEELKAERKASKNKRLHMHTQEQPGSRSMTVLQQRIPKNG